MTGPVSREDLEQARDQIIERLDAMDKSVEGMRSQNSAEHGSLFSKLLHLTEIAHWLKAAWIRFTILPPPPDDKPPR